MIYCVKCGAEIKDGGRFCEKCGTAVEGLDYKLDYTSGAKFSSGKKFNRKAALITVTSVGTVILAVIIFAVVSSVFKSKKLKMAVTVNVADYINVSFEGYDTVGKASAYMDYDGFYNAVMGAIEATGSNIVYEDYAKAEALCEQIYMRVEPSEELSNGDSVSVKINFDKTLAREAGVILDFDGYEEEVQGLEELKLYDFFDYLELQYSGVSGLAYLEYYNVAEIYGLNEVRCDVDKSSYLKIGDEITFSIDDDTADYLLNNYGIILEATEKTYTVGSDDIDEYIGDINEISAELADKMREYADKMIKSQFEYYWDGELSDVEYQGMYFLTPTETNPYIGNYAFVIYKGTVNFNSDNYWSWYGYDEDERDPVDIYLPVEIDNLIQYTDGTQGFDTWGVFWDYSDDDSGVPGYIDEEEMFAQIVAVNKENFQCEMNGKLIEFGK